MKNELLKQYNKTKQIKLVIAIIIDIVGFSSAFIPVAGGIGDMIWGPISGLLIGILFPKHKIVALGGVVEEILPFTDIIPTACIAWTLTYIKDSKKTLTEFLIDKVGEEQLVMEILDKHSHSSGSRSLST
ncbi:hypothetical protein KPL37_15985 [Clostridium frigoris]|uniref:Uncharacterized protein n=1 Tax=Clostridium frigoris TaxID=205327 RepID=A0ABS6BX92_9CLOT|nr:hypothetical protein [Clostridium frigoris]MBU3161220.1 hypothetical protein [Clostridium frigoris]